MKREDLDALHYITPIANVLSILTHGIMSHKRAATLPHQSIAMAEIQDRRRQVVIPNARPLHEYVNLYLCARNPMMYKRRTEHRSICVLRISPDVLALPGVVLADQNASSDYVRFFPSPAGLARIDRELVFAERWTHPDDLIEQFRHRSICVLRISPGVLDLPGVVIADQNASSDYVRFSPSPGGLARIDHDLLFAEWWTHPGDPIEQFRHQSIKCAEVLVPNRVEASYITGAYRSGLEGQEILSTVVPGLAATVYGHMFFR